jgi:hypothetical protein
MRSLAPIVLFLAPIASFAQADGGLSIVVPRVSRPPKLADFVGGTPREAEAKVTDFRQFDPNDGEPVSQPTTAFLSYDSKNLYIAFICKDDPKLIRARVAKRKQIVSDDRITINLDTFHDHRHAYWFDANPYAIQLDGITTDGYGDDYSWEGLWVSEAKITADGYVVLLTIPFRSIRFPDAPRQRWGVMLGRIIQRNNEFAMWPFVSRKRLPQFVAQYADLEGLENISPGRNLQFIPYGLFSRSRYLDQPPAGPPLLATESDARAGLDTKIVIQDALTLEMTLNPDFSQVESDEPQVTVNQRYEVFFPERRPFFMENASYFSTPQTLFFSRRIVDPEYGLRLTGKLGRWGLGVIAADDRAPGKTLSPADSRYGKRATNGVLSLQRDFRRDSHLRFFATDREFASDYNRLGSLDTRLNLGHNLFLTAQAATSVSRSGSSARRSGNAYYVRLNRSGRKFQASSTYTDRSPGFRAALGYIPRTDIREFRNTASYRWWPKSKSVVNFGPTVTALGNWNRSGLVQDWEVDLGWAVEFKRLTYLRYNRGEVFELYKGQSFRKQVNAYHFSTEWFKWMAVSSFFTHGDGVNYYPAAGYLPFAGKYRSAELDLTVRPTSQLRIDETYLYDRLRTSSGWQGSLPSASIYVNHIWRTKVNYQFTREFSLRAIVDYNGVLPNSSLVALDRTKRMNYDLLFTYMLHPGTALYIGYTDLYENLRLDPGKPPYLTLSGFPDFSTGRQIFVKMSYLFRF